MLNTRGAHHCLKKYIVHLICAPCAERMSTVVLTHLETQIAKRHLNGHCAGGSMVAGDSMMARILPYLINLRYAHLYGKITEIVISAKYSEATKNTLFFGCNPQPYDITLPF